jgi:preprotein translocase subunit SecF
MMMGALWAVLGGLVAIFLGIIGLIFWWAYFLKALAATLPAMFIFAGSIALFIGFTEIRDSLKSKEDTDFSSYKPETKEEEEKTEEEKGS